MYIYIYACLYAYVNVELIYLYNSLYIQKDGKKCQSAVFYSSISTNQPH